MLDRHIHQDPHGRQVRHIRFLWGAVGLALAGVLGLGVAIGMQIRRPDLSVLLDQIEQSAQSGLAGVARTHARDARSELARFRRRVLRLSARLRREMHRADFASRPEAIRDRARRTTEELTRLLRQVEGWEASIRETGVRDPEERWTRICVQALNERLRWPLTGVVRHSRTPRPHRWWSDFRDGFLRGAGWPVVAVRNGVRRSPPGMGLLRRALFPYPRHYAFGVFQLLGLGLGVLGVSYVFCWLGMRFNRAWASHAGLAYLAYLIVFSVCLAAVYLGVMP